MRDCTAYTTSRFQRACNVAKWRTQSSINPVNRRVKLVLLHTIPDALTHAHLGLCKLLLFRSMLDKQNKKKKEFEYENVTERDISVWIKARCRNVHKKRKEKKQQAERKEPENKEEEATSCILGAKKLRGFNASVYVTLYGENTHASLHFHTLLSRCLNRTAVAANQKRKWQRRCNTDLTT